MDLFQRHLRHFQCLFIIGIPMIVVIFDYNRSVSPTTVIRAYSFYLDDDGELWMFDYNSTAFEAYYDQYALPGKTSAFDRKFGGNHKERTVEFCVAHNAVEEIIKTPPYDNYAHHIVKVGRIDEKSKYLRVQFICYSSINNKEYPGGIAFPLDMDGLDELRSVFESKADGQLFQKPKEYNEPGVMRIDRVFSDDNGKAILYGAMEAGTLARGDRVTYADEFHDSLFICRITHIYKDGREVVWAIPVEVEGDLGYEFHIKDRRAEEFNANNYLLSK